MLPFKSKSQKTQCPSSKEFSLTRGRVRFFYSIQVFNWLDEAHPLRKRNLLYSEYQSVCWSRPTTPLQEHWKSCLLACLGALKHRSVGPQSWPSCSSLSLPLLWLLSFLALWLPHPRLSSLVTWPLPLLFSSLCVYLIRIHVTAFRAHPDNPG